MLSKREIIKALRDEVAAACPNTSHYMGFLPEEWLCPAFLYTVTDMRLNKYNFFTHMTRISVQIVHFDTTIAGRQDYAEMLAVESALHDFLATGLLPVADRVLKFNAETKIVDNRLNILLDITYIDSSVNAEWLEKQRRDIMTDLSLRAKVNGKEVE